MLISSPSHMQPITVGKLSAAGNRLFVVMLLIPVCVSLHSLPRQCNVLHSDVSPRFCSLFSRKLFLSGRKYQRGRVFLGRVCGIVQAQFWKEKKKFICQYVLYFLYVYKGDYRDSGIPLGASRRDGRFIWHLTGEWRASRGLMERLALWNRLEIFPHPAMNHLISLHKLPLLKRKWRWTDLIFSLRDNRKKSH